MAYPEYIPQYIILLTNKIIKLAKFRLRKLIHINQLKNLFLLYHIISHNFIFYQCFSHLELEIKKLLFSIFSFFLLRTLQPAMQKNIHPLLLGGYWFKAKFASIDSLSETDSYILHITFNMLEVGQNIMRNMHREWSKCVHCAEWNRFVLNFKRFEIFRSGNIINSINWNIQFLSLQKYYQLSKSRNQIMSNCHVVSLMPAPPRKQSNGRWSKTEHQRFMKALEKYGRDWVNVQKFVKSRTLSQVRSHAQKVFLKMSDCDIEALIAGEGDSDIQNNCRSFYSKQETHTRKDNKKKNKQEPSQILLIDRIPLKSQPNLLDIFKRAIQMETIEIHSKDLFSNEQKQMNTSNQYLINIAQAQQQSSGKTQKQPELSSIQQSHGHKIEHSELTQNLQSYQQMQFVLPNFKQLCEPIPAFIH